MPAQRLNQDQLFEVALQEGTAAFEAAIAQYNNERFYAFCFYTDNDVTSIYPTANTLEGFERIYPGGNPSDRNYYKWYPGEWDLDFGQLGDRDLMEATNTLLYPDSSNEANETDEAFGERKRQTLITLTRVLLTICEVKVFANHGVHERLAFWVNIGDAIEQEIEWMFQPALPHLKTNDVHELRQLFEFA